MHSRGEKKGGHAKLQEVSSIINAAAWGRKFDFGSPETYFPNLARILPYFSHIKVSKTTLESSDFHSAYIICEKIYLAYIWPKIDHSTEFLNHIEKIFGHLHKIYTERVRFKTILIYFLG